MGMTKNWIADAEAADTTEKRDAHQDKCPALVNCDHASGNLNEYGDCYECDGQDKRMCPCQNWTW